MFMAYSEPKCWVLPTPGTRASGSRMREAIRSLSALRSMSGSLERRPTTIRKPLLALATTTPCCTTSDGRRGVASDTLFCTCTWAMSGSVPVWKVSVTEARPDELEVELKYSRLSMPVSCCSMTWVTALSVVAALAPGYEADTVTCGGATCGYASTPMLSSEITPASEIRMETTQAKPGWLMKNLDMADQSCASVCDGAASGAG